MVVALERLLGRELGVAVPAIALAEL